MTSPSNLVASVSSLITGGDKKLITGQSHSSSGLITGTASVVMASDSQISDINHLSVTIDSYSDDIIIVQGTAGALAHTKDSVSGYITHIYPGYQFKLKNPVQKTSDLSLRVFIRHTIV